jgi:hypothetical protein
MIIPKIVREIKLPGVGTAGGFSGKKKEKTFISRLQITSHRVLFLV